MLPNGMPMKGLRRNDDSMEYKCWYSTSQKIPLLPTGLTFLFQQSPARLSKTQTVSLSTFH
jgi:hypothetical protein